MHTHGSIWELRRSENTGMISSQHWIPDNIGTMITRAVARYHRKKKMSHPNNGAPATAKQFLDFSLQNRKERTSCTCMVRSLANQNNRQKVIIDVEIMLAWMLHASAGPPIELLFRSLACLGPKDGIAKKRRQTLPIYM